MQNQTYTEYTADGDRIKTDGFILVGVPMSEPEQERVRNTDKTLKKTLKATRPDETDETIQLDVILLSEICERLGTFKVKLWITAPNQAVFVRPSDKDISGYGIIMPLIPAQE